MCGSVRCSRRPPNREMPVPCPNAVSDDSLCTDENQKLVFGPAGLRPADSEPAGSGTAATGPRLTWQGFASEAQQFSWAVMECK